MEHASIQITAKEYKKRIQKLLVCVQEKKLSGVVLFERDFILYFCGFAFIPTERPIALLVNHRGDTALFVPRLELEHANSNSVIDRVESYVEYPYDPRPEQILLDLLKDMGIFESIGSDHDGYPWILGYRGPTLSELTGQLPVRLTGLIEDTMMIKSAGEINLIQIFNYFFIFHIKSLNQGINRWIFQTG